MVYNVTVAKQNISVASLAPCCRHWTSCSDFQSCSFTRANCSDSCCAFFAFCKNRQCGNQNRSSDRPLAPNLRLGGYCILRFLTNSITHWTQSSGRPQRLTCVSGNTGINIHNHKPTRTPTSSPSSYASVMSLQYEVLICFPSGVSRLRADTHLEGYCAHHRI